MSIIGSQLCPAAPEPGGGSADHDGGPGVGCRGDRVRSRGQAFLAHQSDDNLCLYWGTPSRNEGGAWCERLTGCTLARGLALGLDVDGRLVGHCGSKRVWPPDLSKDFQPADYCFEGVARKAVNGNIISTERKLNNFGLTEYRVIEFSWHMLYDGLLPGEAVESDVCLTIFDANKLTSLETGEELLCTHEHVYRPKWVDDETWRPGNTSNRIPGGGFALGVGMKLQLAGVSNCYPAVPQEQMQQRLEANPQMLAFHFRVLLRRVVPGTAPPTTSIRSPRRDRSIALSFANHDAPSTSYANTGDASVRVLGVGVFLSSLAHYVRSTHTIFVRVGPTTAFECLLPAHEPGRTSGSSTLVIPLNASLLPTQVVSVWVRVIGASVAFRFDAAAFVLTDASVGQLQPSTEMQLFPNQVDLNADGFPDNVDYVEDGYMWAERTRVHCDGCDGAHDTQYASVGVHALPWDMRSLRATNVTLVAGFGELTPFFVFRGPASLQDPTGTLICLNVTRPSAKATIVFGVHYCNEERVPAVARNEWSAYADFDGDGLPDRVRCTAKGQPGQSRKLYLGQGGPAGLAPEQLWFETNTRIDHHYVERSPDHGRFVLVLETRGDVKHPPLLSVHLHP